MSSLVPIGGGGLTKDNFVMVGYGKHLIVIWDYAALDHLLKERTGPVGRDLDARADRVKWAAKMQAGMRTGALKMSIHTDWSRQSYGQSIKVGSPLHYALAHHEGTRPHIIFPKTHAKLKFMKKGMMIYADSVVHPGTRPNRYLTDNLYLAVVSSNLPAVP